MKSENNYDPGLRVIKVLILRLFVFFSDTDHLE